MPLAGIDDFKRIVRSWRGKITLGETTSDTMTEAECLAFLNDAEAKLTMELGIAPDTYIDAARTVFIELECKMAMLSAFGTVGVEKVVLETLLDDLTRTKDMLRVKPTAAAITPKTAIVTPFYLEDV